MSKEADEFATFALVCALMPDEWLNRVAGVLVAERKRREVPPERAENVYGQSALNPKMWSQQMMNSYQQQLMLGGATQTKRTPAAGNQAGAQGILGGVSINSIFIDESEVVKEAKKPSLLGRLLGGW